MTEIAPRIVVDEQIRSGRPVIKGTRVPVDVVLWQLAAGLSTEEVANEYSVARDDVLAVLGQTTFLRNSSPESPLTFGASFRWR
jgi:uncharacterized protein (DUF433 family)